MENTWDAFFPFSREMVPMGQNRHYLGAGISFCIHAVAIWCVVFLGPNLSDFKRIRSLVPNSENIQGKYKTYRLIDSECEHGSRYSYLIGYFYNATTFESDLEPFTVEYDDILDPMNV